MDMKQIIFFSFLLLPVCAINTHRCHDEHELNDVADKRLRSHYPQPPDPTKAADPDSDFSCPLELYQLSTEPLHRRSLSPWRYVTRTNKDLFPSTYVEAQCLCSGCILIQDTSGPEKMSPVVESHDYNSVPMRQSRVFLKRELCSDGKNYHLKPVNVKVTVGCSCAIANTSSD